MPQGIDGQEIHQEKRDDPERENCAEDFEEERAGREPPMWLGCGGLPFGGIFQHFVGMR